MNRLVKRATNKARRTLAAKFRRRDLRIETPVPLVSFTFDDAPCSAFDAGREILETYRARGTYFVSLGLIDQVTEIGRIAGPDRIRLAMSAGHEIGCHTFHHVDAWHVSASTYIKSVDDNGAELKRLFPGAAFRSFAYPKSGATLGVKAALGDRFECCRGGGQGINTGVVDRNLLNACFLDVRAEIDLAFVRRLIDQNSKVKGWLIFAAHDIAPEGSVYRCTPSFFSDVVGAAAGSGADLIPVGEACDRLTRAGAA